MRALSVTAVVLYHFQVPGFDAGYLGVDVFFVISGYLMAGILIQNLEGHRPKPGEAFRLLGRFYLARARRILPGLVVLVGILLAAGWWALPPGDYEQLATHGKYALAFASNYQFYNESGYFDMAAHEKWLLHTWSLSIEWQFYLIFPFIIIITWLVAGGRRIALVPVLVGLTLASFANSVITTTQSPEAGFYFLSSRAWELLFGALVYVFSSQIAVAPIARRWMEVAGIGILVASLVYYNKLTDWPGSAAALPVTGAALVLLADRHTTSWAMPWAVQWLGRTSYSLYLWHWPLFVGLVYFDVHTVTWAVITGIALSVLLSSLSFVAVERPSQRRLMYGGSKQAATLLMALAGITTCSVAVAIEGFDGVPGRMPERVQRIVAETNNVNPHREECHGRPEWEEFPWCKLGGANIRAVVVGDSHAASLATSVLEAVAPAPNDGIIMTTYTSCQTLLGARKPNEQIECAEFNHFVRERLDVMPKEIPLVIINRLSSAAFGSHLPENERYKTPTVYFGDEPVERPTETFLARFRKHVVDTACSLAEDREIYWMRPTPEMPYDVPRWLARQSLIRGEGVRVEATLPLEAYRQRNEFVTGALAEAEEACVGVNVLDPESWLCDEENCYGSQDGVPLYYDEHHLSERGNQELIPMFQSIR